MRKLVFLVVVLGLGTACPKVERQVYRFDLKSRTGTLTFENIVTDSAETPNKDFMEIVDKVLEGTKVEEDHPGWRVGEKQLKTTDAPSGKRLDGEVAFSFDDLDAAGIYKHDKKAPYIWCTPRESEDEQVIVATNGTRIDTLPGCIAWDRKATELTVTVRTATLLGGEQSLVPQYEKWSKGETLEIEETEGGSFDGLEGLGEAFAGGMAQGMADAMAGDAVITIGDPVSKDAPKLAAGALGSVERSVLEVCAAGSAAKGERFQETVRFAVAPDGTATGTLLGAAEASPMRPEREKCYATAMKDRSLPARDTAWTFDVSIAVSDPK
jgi:hypothetical protein